MSTQQRFIPGYTYPRGGGSGFKGRVVERVKDWVLVEITHPDISTASFEVVKVRQHKARQAHGRMFEEGEHLAGTGEWGVYGFTRRDIADARRCLDQKANGTNAKRAGSDPKCRRDRPQRTNEDVARG